jgi:2-polyprenyl-3-methyl-5-hydroxy-6-metoxy-1,4-benzoquinol methylase
MTLGGPTQDDVRRVWDTNAAFWDGYIGAEGNGFHRLLIAPVQMRLLALKPGERVLEIACGNGQFSREMARAGANVLATDFAESFLERARAHTGESGLEIDYRTADATDEAQILALGDPASFDAAVCTMAIHDIADIAPMMRALRTLLRPEGRFVFSVLHPCFNRGDVLLVNTTEDDAGILKTQYTVSVRNYLEWGPKRGIGIVGQPEPHWYFERPLHELLRPCFDAGLVLDALEEPAFPAGHGKPDRPASWSNYPHIPPALVVRLRPSEGRN